MLKILDGRLSGKIGQGEHRLAHMASLFHSVGLINAEGPPVPFPNTEVKLCRADDT